MDHAARFVMLDGVITRQLTEVNTTLLSHPQSYVLHHYLIGRQAILLDLKRMIDSTLEDGQ